MRDGPLLQAHPVTERALYTQSSHFPPLPILVKKKVSAPTNTTHIIIAVVIAPGFIFSPPYYFGVLVLNA